MDPKISDQYQIPVSDFKTDAEDPKFGTSGRSQSPTTGADTPDYHCSEDTEAIFRR
jgi:hypothetical protein